MAREYNQLVDISDENIARLERRVTELDSRRPLTLEEHKRFVSYDWELTKAKMVLRSLGDASLRGTDLGIVA